MAPETRLLVWETHTSVPMLELGAQATSRHAGQLGEVKNGNTHTPLSRNLTSKNQFFRTAAQKDIQGGVFTWFTTKKYWRTVNAHHLVLRLT